MSTDRKRINKAIQRIAREDPEIRNLLDEFRNSGGKPSESATSGSGAEDRQICCDGSSPNNPNPGSDTRDPADGDQDGLDPNDPSNLGNLDGGCLTGVTNCATGEAICFCGDDFIPPDGWDGPSDPPPDDTWVEGVYWEAVGSTFADRLSAPVATFATCGGARSYALTESGCEDGPTCDGSGHSGTCSVNGVLMYYRYSPVICDGSHPELCPDEAPLLESWPSDSCTNLAIKGGKIVGSKYDPENDGSYSAPMSEIQLCDGANSMYLSPSADGGWKTINAARSEGYLYNSKFEQIAHIDGNEYSDPNI